MELVRKIDAVTIVKARLSEDGAIVVQCVASAEHLPGLTTSTSVIVGDSAAQRVKDAMAAALASVESELGDKLFREVERSRLVAQQD